MANTNGYWHPHYDNIPLELRSQSIWLRWKLTQREGADKPTKVPYKSDGSGRAKTNDPATWSSFEDAAKHKGGDGLGCMVNGDYAAIDLDNCRDPQTGKLEAWAQSIVDEIGSYTEISPSGHGVHIWVKGTVPSGGNRRGRVEMYDQNSPRYLTVTGQPLNGYADIKAYDLTELHKRMLEGLDPQEKVKKAATAVDDSNEDYAFCKELIKKGKTDAEIDAAMRASNLIRPKWDEQRPAPDETYGRLTIRKAREELGVFISSNPLPRERMSEVKAEKIEWLWQGRFPLGMAITLIGQGGVGKSMVTEEIAARVSSGRDFPDGAKNTLNPSDVILMNNEDSPGKSIQPRLQAAGADLKKIIRIKLEESGFAADRDIARLEETLKAEPNVRLLIIDPIADMIGETNNNSASEVRQKVLNPLSKMAVKYNLCVLIVCHTNKKEGMSAINRVDGTQAYVSGVRGSWLMLPWDEDDVLAEGERGIVLQFNKSNCFPHKKGLKGKIVTVPFTSEDGQTGETAKIDWLGETDKTAQETLDAASDPDIRKGKRAVQWLREHLCDDSKPATDVFTAGKDLGFSDTAIHRASVKLNVVKTRANGRSIWSLPVAA